MNLSQMDEIRPRGLRLDWLPTLKAGCPSHPCDLLGCLNSRHMSCSSMMCLWGGKDGHSLCGMSGFNESSTGTGDDEKRDTLEI